MLIRPPIRRCVGALIAVLALPSRAGADDWPQFRRDGGRQARSPDPVGLPLTPIWAAQGGAVSVWQGRAFYLTGTGRRHLVCSDVRTGTPLWTRPLPGVVSPDFREVHPAVSASGVVFVYDGLRGSDTASASAASGPGGRVRLQSGASARQWLLAFKAENGDLLARWPSADGAGGVGARLVLPQIGRGAGVLPRPVALLPWLGLPLITGESLAAASTLDFMLRWTPGRSATLTRFALDSPVRNDPDGVLSALFYDYPPAAAPGGMIVAGHWKDESGLSGDRDFLALWDGGTGIRWHRTFVNGLGIVSVEAGDAFVGVGVPGGKRAIAALDAQTGAPRWLYAPLGLGPDAVKTGTAGGARGVRSAVSGAALSQCFKSNPGLVLGNGRVYGEVCGAIVALDQARGVPQWRFTLPEGRTTASIVASREHLFLTEHAPERPREAALLRVLRLDNGKEEWSRPLPQPGALTLAHGLLFSAEQNLRVFAPAERTFHLAVDSDRRGDYRRSTSPDRAEGDIDAPKPAPGAEPKPGIADATFLRLTWGRPVEAMLRAGRERKDAAAGAPLLLSLDWLDRTRSRPLGLRLEPNGLPARTEFAALCERLASELRPAHLDLAPEVNVFLDRRPDLAQEVVDLVREAAVAVRRASPDTKVLVSYNAEVVAGRYGRGTSKPFGELRAGERRGPERLVGLADLVDEVGLTSYPEAAFRSPDEVPGDYLVGLRNLFRDKPVVVCGLAAVYRRPAGRAQDLQSAWMARLFQLTYWLDAVLVAYPDVEAEETGVRTQGQERPAAGVIRDVLGWKRVTRLKAPAASLKDHRH